MLKILPFLILCIVCIGRCSPSSKFVEAVKNRDSEGIRGVLKTKLDLKERMTVEVGGLQFITTLPDLCLYTFYAECLKILTEKYPELDFFPNNDDNFFRQAIRYYEDRNAPQAGREATIDYLIALAGRKGKLAKTEKASLVSTAIFYCKSKIVQLFIRKGFPVDRGLLVSAASCTTPDTVKVLVESGVSVNDRSEAGGTALTSALGNNRKETAHYLIAKHCDVNKGNLFRPIHMVASDGDTELLKFLIAAGANANDVGDEGQTALHVAAMGGHSEIISLLIAAGADVNVQDRKGFTPLHSVVDGSESAAKRLPAFERLLDSNPNLELRSKEGQTVLELILSNRHEDPRFEELVRRYAR